ncbi:hypothetical protein NKI77_29770 [Mesorhizobium opportunistum]|uniref:hypothetical protein n=1 Tax=Mesorhizobium opportunistum TaxID=593909 RepID=UPI00333C758A
MNARRLASIESKIRTPEFVRRIARLREVVDQTGDDGLPVERAAEMLDLPAPVVRIIFAYHEASLVERRAERMAHNLINAPRNGALLS